MSILNQLNSMFNTDEIKIIILLLILSIIYIYRELEAKRLRTKELYQKDFFRTDYSYRENSDGLKEKKERKRIKVILNSDRLEFRVYNRTFDLETFRDKKQFLEFLFDCQFIDPIKKNRPFQNQASIIFKKEKFSVLENYEIKDTSPNQIFLGLNSLGQEVFENVTDTNAYLFAGSQGSGKTQSILRTMEAYQYHNPQLNEWIIVDTKSNHFKKFGNKVYRLQELEEYKELNERIESLLKLNQQYSEKNELNPNPVGLVFEEALDYLKTEKGIDKEEAKERERLQRNIQIFIRKCREFSQSPVIVGVQEVSTTALNIPTSLFKAKLYGRVPTQQQCLTLGLSKDGMDKDLKHGRWIRVETSEKSQFPLSLTSKYTEHIKSTAETNRKKEAEEADYESDTSEGNDLSKKEKTPTSEKRQEVS